MSRYMYKVDYVANYADMERNYFGECFVISDSLSEAERKLTKKLKSFGECSVNVRAIKQQSSVITGKHHSNDDFIL